MPTTIANVTGNTAVSGTHDGFGSNVWAEGKAPSRRRFGYPGVTGSGRAPVLYRLCACRSPCMSRSALGAMTPRPGPLRPRRRALGLARGASGSAWSTVSCASCLACRASRSASGVSSSRYSASMGSAVSLRNLSGTHSFDGRGLSPDPCSTHSHVRPGPGLRTSASVCPSARTGVTMSRRLTVRSGVKVRISP